MLKTNSLFTASALENLKVGLKADPTKCMNKIGPTYATSQRPAASYFSQQRGAIKIKLGQTNFSGADEVKMQTCSL